jgi:serine/threonine protein kinase
MIGTILSNRYKIIAQLGSGGMAWVYLAEDLREQTRVAVKVLYPQYSQDLQFLRRFMQEAKLAMSLSQCAPQRQIVCVLDYGSDRDTHYLVMEFVQGRDLSQILEEQKTLPWREALAIARQVAEALSSAHHLDIVHRDIKPGNIMILPDGTVRVLDFGIARARTSPELTLSGFVGSPNYAAPEQALGGSVDTRADIYSLGIVLYKMLSGNLPFEGNTPWAIVNQHIASLPPPLEKLCPDLPEPVVHLVHKAIAKRPEDRFQTPDEMVQAIEAILAGHDLPPEVPSAGQCPAPQELDELYERGQQAVEAEQWQEAVDLFSQILKSDPDYRDVTDQLSATGEQIQLTHLYRSAKRALELGQWDNALAQLDRIAETAPNYRNIQDLRAEAQKKGKAVTGGRHTPSEYPTQVTEQGLDLATIPAFPPAGEEEQSKLAAASERDSRRSPPWAILPVLILALAVMTFFLIRSEEWPTSVFRNTPATTPSPGASATSPTVRPSAAGTGLLLTQTLSITTPLARLTLTLTPIPSPCPTPTPTLTPTATPMLPVVARTSLAGQIAFPRFDPSRGTYDVYVCHVDGSQCRRVASEASQPDFLPPDTGSGRIVLHSWKADDKGLVLQTLSGQRIWKITASLEAARPSVDFQGKIYAYHSRQEADRLPRLYRTYGLETRPIKREANAVLGLSPSWLPDGRILYSGCLQDRCGIIVMRADGTFPRQVVAGGSEANPEASPDGQRVAFMSQRDGNWEVYVVNLDGTGLQRLTRNPTNDGLPTWSPDGRHIAFVSDRDGHWAVWAMDPDGSNQRRLFALGGPLDGQVQNANPHETNGWVEERISWSSLP